MTWLTLEKDGSVISRRGNFPKHERITIDSEAFNIERFDVKGEPAHVSIYVFIENLFRLDDPMTEAELDPLR